MYQIVFSVTCINTNDISWSVNEKPTGTCCLGKEVRMPLVKSSE